MAGILAAIKLEEAGFNDVTVYEKGERLGGTWRENTYPGIGCDVPSHLYCYSFAPNPDWSYLFSPGEEILAYLEAVAREHGVDRRVRLGEEVLTATFTDGRWQLTTSLGAHDEADVVIAATGVLHHPRYPDIPGLDTFAGMVFHSARWDNDVRIDGARVGVIGTGSSAVQITGAIADRVEHFTLFQRTAQWILQQNNRSYSDDERDGFRADRAALVEMHDQLSVLFAEGFANAVVDADSAVMKMLAEACRVHLETAVRDPELRELLRPDYRAGCKRLVISDHFYDAIQRPNAELVTTVIERAEPEGIRTIDGRLHELDVLVLATGFKVDAFMRPMAVTGRDGLRLEDLWAKRPGAYLSISIPDFPNLFMLNGPNGPVGNFSLIEVAELQMAYVLQVIELLRRDEAREVCATWEAMEQHEAARAEAATRTVWATGCRSWYLDDRGVPAAWPWTFDRFRAEMAAPQLTNYDLVR
jgi:cation diffusion facilitator CzcD-associated flavoprotein CzcO